MDLWISPDDCCSPATDATADQRLVAATAASEFMWAHTGRRYGIGIDTVRPCRTRTGGPSRFDLPSTDRFIATGPMAFFHGTCGCSRPSDCGCRQKDHIRLPRDRVRQILEVKVDGEVISADQYRLRRPNRLYRLDGTWPCCQDLALEDDEEGTWSVRYQFGRPVPAIGLIAARRLACEYLKALVDDPTCRLPGNARSVTARGISVDLGRLLDQGVIGLFEVDAAFESLGKDERASAWSPELDGRAVRVEPLGS